MEPAPKRPCPAAVATTLQSAPLLEVRSVGEGRGRGLFTRCAVAGGEVLARETPALRWVDPSQSSHVCGWCLAYSAEPLPHPCPGGCGARVGWCSEACRERAAPSHRCVCPLLKPLCAGAGAGGGASPPPPESDALYGLVAGLCSLTWLPRCAADLEAVDALCEGGCAGPIYLWPLPTSHHRVASFSLPSSRSVPCSLL
jgi:hypothetical protein